METATMGNRDVFIPFFPLLVLRSLLSGQRLIYVRFHRLNNIRASPHHT